MKGTRTFYPHRLFKMLPLLGLPELTPNTSSHTTCLYAWKEIRSMEQFGLEHQELRMLEHRRPRQVEKGKSWEISAFFGIDSRTSSTRWIFLCSSAILCSFSTTRCISFSWRSAITSPRFRSCGTIPRNDPIYQFGCRLSHLAAHIDKFETPPSFWTQLPAPHNPYTRLCTATA